MLHNLRSRIARAARLYADFTGHDGVVLGKVDFPANPGALVAIGELIDIGYKTVREGRTERYRHTFAAHARPVLASSFDGEQLYIIGGEYDFTDRGIMDRKKER